ncbi:hypothetical protein LTR28_010280 [Elasticomyces elasticus]|nr:hypothetical protein LTR28_010280 [Elasticomyces elasticus]
MASLFPFRDINVHASSSHYAFSSPSTPSALTLVVDRPSGDIRLSDGKMLGGQRVSSISGILGIIKLRLATEFLPLRERQIRDPDEDAYLALVKNTIKSGPMYFSYSFDLTNTFQRQAHSDSSVPLWKRADSRFFWNRFIQSDLIDFRQGLKGGLQGAFARQSVQRPAVDPYILPVMFGMMNTTNTSIKGTSLTFVLITRRSRYRAGTRYFSRGIDERGNVSNFNETEQAVILNDDASSGLSSFAGHEGYEDSKPKGIGRETQVLSYVQTRGSVPVYWAEVNTLQYTPKLQIRGVESAVQAAKRHFDEQIRLYGDNYLVNLVNEKGRERRVKEAYEEIVKLLLSSPEEGIEADSRSREKFGTIEAQSSKQQFDRLHYIYFDFHNETKGLKWHRAQLLLDQLQPALEKQQYFYGVDAPDGRIDVRNQQTSVVRTNCMDCLDRTNVVQSMLGRWVLSRMLVDLGLLQPGQSAQDDAAFENVFRNIWADNADVVSKSYSGTGALKTDFTRTGNRTRAGMLQDVTNSVTRYIRNNFADGPRQDGFDLLLGAYVPDSSGMGSALHFVDRRPLVIQCVPYILAGCLFFVMTSLFTRRMPDATAWPLRILVWVCLAVAVWAGMFIRGHGALYVNWPKLNTPPWATEGYQDALDRVGRDHILGPLFGVRNRGKSDVRLGYLEEGKKRIE